MMVEKQKETGGPAFPTEYFYDDDTKDERMPTEGMTLRQYAAIKLKVPHSGVDWLDEMIVQSIRNDFAAKALHSFNALDIDDERELTEQISEFAYCLADTMLKDMEVCNKVEVGHAGS